MVRIAVDAYGGDHAPHAVIVGALQALATLDDRVHLCLVGDAPAIHEAVAQHTKALGMSSAWRARLTVQHASQVIEADEEPVRAVQQKKDASMVVAAKLVRERKVDAMITAGNTGAFLVAGMLLVGRIRGIERPALAPVVPTLDGTGVLVLDVGANMDASEKQLVQYAQMGTLYRQKVHHMPNPRVGLLNVGTEPTKGNKLTKAVYEQLRQQSDISFVGNVEAKDILQGACDVLICDGFVGNIFLKSSEGVASTVFSALKTEMTQTWWASMAGLVLRKRLRAFRRKFDEQEVAIAPLLGLQGLLLKCHGSSQATTIHNALFRAVNIIEADVLGAMTAMGVTVEGGDKST
jgi:glycerol-3-phosphate acyltransferase PlsX